MRLWSSEDGILPSVVERTQKSFTSPNGSAVHHSQSPARPDTAAFTADDALRHNAQDTQPGPSELSADHLSVAGEVDSFSAFLQQLQPSLGTDASRYPVPDWHLPNNAPFDNVFSDMFYLFD